MEKEYIFKGESYSSYYQLEKVMKIPRKTIQYRHEVIGLSLDEVPEYTPKPPLERLGEKRYYPVSNKERKDNNEDELQKVIEYPKSPGFFVDDNADRTEERKQEYISWLENAPETLIKRELRICEKDLQELENKEEQESFYIFASPYHEEEKDQAEKTIQVIKEVINNQSSN